MSTRSRITRLFPLATLTLVLLAACPGTTSIRTLLDDGGRYDGKTVRIAGEVTESVGALGFGGYQVNDGTGTLTVVVQSGSSSPRIGARVWVEGTFRHAFTLGSMSGAVLMEKRHKVE